MKNIISIIAVFCILSSCTSCDGGGHQYDLPKDKIPILKNNDTICFQDSVSSKIDTFKLRVDDNLSFDRKYNTYRNILLSYKNLYTIDSDHLVYYIMADSEGSGASSGTFQDGVWYSIYYSHETVLFYNKMNIGLKTFKQVTYSSVFMVNYNAPDSLHIPNKVYYTYPNGIIRYEYKDGRVYNLVSK